MCGALPSRCLLDAGPPTPHSYADDACPNATGGGTIPIADLWDTNQPAWAAAVGNRYEEVIFAERAADVIRAHPAGQPLFLFYAFHLVHAPLEVPQPYIDRRHPATTHLDVV